MHSHNDVFTLIKFYDDNKNIIGSSQSDLQDIILTTETKDIEETTLQIAIDTKLQTLEYFKVAIDVPAFNSTDYNKIRRLLIDWYSANKTFSTLQKNTSDPNTLEAPLLEEAIKSMGFNYSHLITQKDSRAQFLLNLTELYKTKGSPQTMLDALKFFGFFNVKVYEWWLVRDHTDDKFTFEGRKVNTTETEFESVFPETRLLDYEDFELLADPHWFYNKAKILELDNDPDRGLLGLPSGTPYFSLASIADIGTINESYLIISRLVKDQYDNHIAGTPPPKDILIDAFRYKVSLLSLFLSILYIHWKYNDFLKYDKLRDYVITEFFVDPETDLLNPFTFEQPNSYEKLLFWTIARVNAIGDPDPFDITASNKAINLPKVKTIPDLPVTAELNTLNTVLIGASGTPEIYKYNGTSWDLSEIPFIAKQPQSETSFKLYPACHEVYDSEVDVSSDLNDSFLNFDDSVINYDEKVLYPLLNRSPNLPDFAKYLYATDDDIPNYNLPFTQVVDLEEEITETIAAYKTTIERPTDYDDAKAKLDTLLSTYHRNQSLNFLQNKINPEALLTALNPEFKADIDARIGTDLFSSVDIEEILFIELDAFSAGLIGKTPIDLKQLLLGIPNIDTKFIPVVDFWKPKRARFLAFELIYQISNALTDSINLKDTLSQTISETYHDTIRGVHRENYDVYPYSHDQNHVRDEVTVSMTLFNDDPIPSIQIATGPHRLYPCKALTGDDLSAKNDLVTLADDEGTTYTIIEGDRIVSSFDHKIYVAQATGTTWVVAYNGTLTTDDIFRVDTDLTKTPGSAEVSALYFYNGSSLDLII